MKLLSNTLTLYGFVFGIPLFCLFFTIFALGYGHGAIKAGIPFLALISYWAFTFTHWKTVYYDGATLHIFNVFSKNATIVPKEYIGSISRLWWYDPRYYKITYIDENRNDYYVYFQRDRSLNDFDDIVDKLNE